MAQLGGGGIGSYSVPGMPLTQEPSLKEQLVPDAAMQRRTAIGLMVAKNPELAARVLSQMGIAPDHFMSLAAATLDPSLSPGAEAPVGGFGNMDTGADGATLNLDAVNPMETLDQSRDYLSSKGIFTQGNGGVGKYYVPGMPTTGGPPGSPSPIVNGPAAPPPQTLDPQWEATKRFLFDRNAYPGTPETVSPAPVTDLVAPKEPGSPPPPGAAPPVIPAPDTGAALNVNAPPAADYATQVLKGKGASSGAPAYSGDQPAAKDQPVVTAEDHTKAADASPHGDGTPDLATALNSMLTGVTAPKSPSVPAVATPRPPDVQPIKGSQVAELMQAIFGSRGGPKDGPASLSAALRGI